jgi:hypothetical protein
MDSHDLAVEKQLADLKRSQDDFETQKKEVASNQK